MERNRDGTEDRPPRPAGLLRTSGSGGRAAYDLVERLGAPERETVAARLRAL